MSLALVGLILLVVGEIHGVQSDGAIFGISAAILASAHLFTLNILNSERDPSKVIQGALLAGQRIGLISLPLILCVLAPFFTIFSLAGAL